VVSPRAKAKIRQWFAQEEKTQAVHFGHDLLEKEMRRAGLAKSRLANPEVMKSLGFKNLDEINAAVAFGQFPVGKILQTLDPEKFKAALLKTPPKAPASEGADLSGGVMVSGIGDVFVRLAKCCSPLPGEPVVGYITQGHGVSLHSAACSTLAGLDPDRLVSVSWNDHQENLVEVHLRVRGLPSPAVFAAVMDVISRKAENTLEAHLSNDGAECYMLFRVSVFNQSQFAELLRAIKELPVVKHAERFFPA
jgi:GTP pyrophosphokinase